MYFKTKNILLILFVIFLILIILCHYYKNNAVEKFGHYEIISEGCNDSSNFTYPNDRCGWGRYLFKCDPGYNLNWNTIGTDEYNNPEWNRAYRELCMPPTYTPPPVAQAPPPPPQPQSPPPPPPPPSQHQTDPPPESTHDIPTTYHEYDWSNPDSVIYPSYINSDDNYFNYCTFGKHNHWCINRVFREACRDECDISFIA